MNSSFTNRWLLSYPKDSSNIYFTFILYKSRRENPQKLTQLGPRSHPRHLLGKRTAQKDAIKGITNDSQVNSYFPYRWSPASLTINICFYLFLYLYKTRMTINNGTPILKSLKSQTRRSTLGRPAIQLLRGGLQQVCGRPALALSSALVPQTLRNQNFIGSIMGSCYLV